MHVHVVCPDGEAKYWLEPAIELARSHKLRADDLSEIESLVREHEQEIRDAWNRHFGP